MAIAETANIIWNSDSYQNRCSSGLGALATQGCALATLRIVWCLRFSALVRVVSTPRGSGRGMSQSLFNAFIG